MFQIRYEINFSFTPQMLQIREFIKFTTDASLNDTFKIQNKKKLSNLNTVFSDEWGQYK